MGSYGRVVGTQRERWLVCRDCGDRHLPKTMPEGRCPACEATAAQKALQMEFGRWVEARLGPVLVRHPEWAPEILRALVMPVKKGAGV